MSASIAGVGARGPLGMTALMVAMCARAQKLEPRSTKFVDHRGDPIGVCTTSALSPDLTGFDRFVELGAPALEEACPANLASPIPLMLALPEAGRPGVDERIATDLVGALSAVSGVSLDLGRSRTFRAGHAAGALAMEAALAELPNAPAVIVGGIDSYYHPDTLSWLDEERRIAGGDGDAILPSEAAAFLLLMVERPSAGSKGHGSNGVASIAQADKSPSIRRVMTAREETIATGEPNLGVAMTRIMRSLVEANGGAVGWALTDLSGERHRTKEWARVVVRLGLSERFAHGDAVHLFGEIGAASGPALAAMAAVQWRVGCAPAPHAIVALHSDGPERGAMLLEGVP